MVTLVSGTFLSTVFKSRPHISQVSMDHLTLRACASLRLFSHREAGNFCNGQRTQKESTHWPVGHLQPYTHWPHMSTSLYDTPTPVHMALLRAPAPEPSPKTLTPPIKPKPPCPLSHRQPGTTVSAKRTSSSLIDQYHFSVFCSCEHAVFHTRKLQVHH